VEDDIFIPAGLTGNVTIPGSGVDIRSFIAEGNFTFLGGIWRVSETVRATQTLTFSGGEIVGATILPGYMGEAVKFPGTLRIVGSHCLAMLTPDRWHLRTRLCYTRR